MTQCVVAFTIPIQRAASSSSSAAAAAESGFTKINPFASLQKPIFPMNYLVTRRFMNDDSKNEENKTNDSSEQINETKKSTAQKAKNGILLIPFFAF